MTQYRGFALSSLTSEVVLTSNIEVALLENLRRCARYWLPYLTDYWATPDAIELQATEQVGQVNPDAGLVSVQIVPNFDGVPGTEGDLAYHDTDEFGRPRCRISWAAVKANGGTMTGPLGLTVAISHELLECLVDPTCKRTLSTVFGTLNPDGFDEPLEVCDRLQGSDYCEPTSPGIYVANATTPLYWGAHNGSNPMRLDIRGDVEAPAVLAPFVQLPGGYYETLPDGQLHFGNRVTDATKARLLRTGPRAGMRRARR